MAPLVFFSWPVIPGAAGGPKALDLSGLDKAIFGDWLPRVEQERSLIGSSIGSWRFAAVASSSNPRAQLAKLAELYTSQRFSKGVSAAEVTRQSIQFLEELIGGREEYILEHPWYRLNVVVVRSLGMLEPDTRARLSFGLMTAVSANMIGRRHPPRTIWNGCRTVSCLIARISKLTQGMTAAESAHGEKPLQRVSVWAMSFLNCWKPAAWWMFSSLYDGWVDGRLSRTPC